MCSFNEADYLSLFFRSNCQNQFISSIITGSLGLLFPWCVRAGTGLSNGPVDLCRSGGLMGNPESLLVLRY